jgi:predicted SnoaL-like aldol condensation-catalyzing enzyme
MAEDTTTVITNGQLVRDYLDVVWNQGRTDAADQYLDEQLIQHNPNLPDGRAPLVEFIEGFKKQIPQGSFTIRRLLADGDLVAAHSLFTTGPDDRGTAVVDVFRIAEGRIVEHWDVKEAVPETTTSGHPIV